MFLKTIAINVASRGITCGTMLCDLLDARDVSIAALSDCNIHRDSPSSWCAEWRSSPKPKP